MKKKKKSVHLRRVRERSQNKSHKYQIKYFFRRFDLFFKQRTKKNLSFCSFLLKFKAINIQKIQKMFKKFGLNRYYILINVLDLNLFWSILDKKYDKLKFNKAIKYNNVEDKKRLFLHVSYRHYLRLPVRGQRTKTNAKTRKHYVII